MSLEYVKQRQGGMPHSAVWLMTVRRIGQQEQGGFFPTHSRPQDSPGVVESKVHPGAPETTIGTYRRPAEILSISGSRSG